MRNTKMTGIDYARADLNVRGLFSFTGQEWERAILSWRQAYPELSFLLLSTCNRTELWVSGDRFDGISLPGLLCRAKGLSGEVYRSFFEEREGEDAVSYLFRLTCGMESQIFMEDQIITQVKQTLQLSRELSCTDSQMDKLFSSAIATAKRIKSEIRLKGNGISVMNRVLELVRHHNHPEGTPCLVIGNGEMGRLAAETLLAAGFPVTMTVRQYHKGEVRIPHGCQVVSYEQRLGCIPESGIVVSATSSPHCTLHYEAVKVWAADNKPRLFFDLAVPRDISQRIAGLPGITLYDVDTIGAVLLNACDREMLLQADQMIEDGIADYRRWERGRRLAPRIDSLSGDASEEILWRLEKTVRSLDISGQEREQLREEISQAAYKSVSSLLFQITKSREGL